MARPKLPYFRGQISGAADAIVHVLAEKRLGIRAEVACKTGSVKCFISNMLNGKQFKDMVTIDMIKFGNRNKTINLYAGPINPRSETEFYDSLSDDVVRIVLEHNDYE